MKKLLVILALAILLVPGIVMAAAPYSYCTWNGDPVLRYGFNMLDPVTHAARPGGSYNQPGPDYVTMYPGGIVHQYIALGDAGDLGSVPGCGHGDAGGCCPDTFCTSATSKRGWAVTAVPPIGSMQIQLYGAGYVIYQDVYLAIPCSAVPGAPAPNDKDTLIFREHYWDTKDARCAPECGDCINPNFRSGVRYYNADTLIVTIVPPPPSLAVFQDTVTLVERGQVAANIPFTICDQDPCIAATYGYNIRSKGHVGTALNVTGSTGVIAGGDCKDVYAIIDAEFASQCNWDTLKIIAWTTVGSPIIYDTCVQRIHVIEPQPVPLFTVPVVTILVLALILAAAVFMRRRAVSKA